MKESLNLDLKKQIHEQFATNKNESSSFLLTAVLGTIIVLGAWGYAMLHSSTTFVVEANVEYKPLSVILLSVCSMTVLFILFHLTVKIGAKNRRDQLVIDDILEDANLTSDIYEKHLAKDKTRKTFLVAYFDTLALILSCLVVMVAASTEIYILFADISASNICDCPLHLINILGFTIFALTMYIDYNREFKQYKKMTEKQDK